MVKRHGKLWEKITTIDNIELAFNKAKKGKSTYQAILDFEAQKERNLKKIQRSLINKTFKTAQYRAKTIYEPKERVIYSLPFYPDRIVHHALMNVLEPIFVGFFIKDSYACIKNRGIHIASKKTTQYVRNNKYCLKCDIRKFYPSINHNVLIKIIERKIKCKDTLWLIKSIINSFEGETNAPIGNLTSQWFGNLYMNELDTFVKQKLRIKNYIRYCDDFCLYSNDKSELNNAKKEIENFLKNELKLKLSKCDLFQTSRGVDFLGYRHFKNYILLRKSTAKRVRRRLPKVLQKYKEGKITKDIFRSIIESTMGWITWANTRNFQLKTHILELKELAYAE
jgi:retron-type reverse transcriptase